MADKSTQLIVDALERAVADPSGLPLHGGKTEAGLFNGSTLARQAAQRCMDKGYLQVVRTETRGRAVHEICTITDQGLSFLAGQVSPKQVLEDFLRSLDARQNQLAELTAAARHIHASLDDLKTIAGKVLRHFEKPAPAVDSSEASSGELIAFLSQWPTTAPSGDCPLPELYRFLRQSRPELTVGGFHDTLRRLHDLSQIYLHPWTGPLYDLPEPPIALLIGHEVAYYASLRP